MSKIQYLEFLTNSPDAYEYREEIAQLVIEIGGEADVDI